ncbi:MAG TPA: MBL fold metallo-hydrolase [Candidatus Dormibacteraeota bacterium]|nr:MBL fold metallo-hydrolase [Candidatus Dormibacteraeota bacterium]
MSRATTILTFLATGNPTGLKFTLEHGEARAIFDFGREHAPGRDPFSLGITPRGGRELDDLLAVGLAPRLEGVYHDWDGRTSVFISHLHLDHTYLVRYLHPAVPLYYPAEMEPLRRACAESGVVPWRIPAGSGVEDGTTVRCGEIAVRFVAVDHDLPGATGFLIQTPDLTLAYTGDHRWHGLHPEKTQAFAAAARGVDVLVQEAVSLAPRELDASSSASEPAPRLTEAGVVDGFEKAMAAASGVVVVDLYPMNRERVAAFGAACERHGRRLVLEPGPAAVAAWPEVLTDLAGVRAAPARYCVALSFESLPLLIDLHPPTGSLFIHSDGTPLGVWDPAWPVLMAWVDRFGLAFVQIASSGHSRPEDLHRMVDAVRPGVVLPVHTRAPEALETGATPRLIPKPLEAYTAEFLRGLRG